MKTSKYSPSDGFFKLALYLLIIGLIAGVLSAIIYISPQFLKTELGLVKLRPIHVTSVMFWIIIGASGGVYYGLSKLSPVKPNGFLIKMQWLLLLVALGGIFFSYLTGDFGGREYWEFNPIWAFPIFLSWVLFLINFIQMVKPIKKWPVYVWMWMTGIVFFLFIFLENYLWVFSFFRQHFVTDMTIQWKVNGSLVGAINQMIYGTAFFLMDKINNNESSKVAHSRLAFGMYFLGLTNLMFNWGHHIYTLPTESYIRYVAYAVSMTEWVFFIKIIYNWKQSLSDIQKNYHFYPYRFLMAADFWVFINMGQAILMSIPAINIYTHGTHVTVAHAMGTTIGINSMILFAVLYMKFSPKFLANKKPAKLLSISFWITQLALLVFLAALDSSGFIKGMWQMEPNHGSFSAMMDQLIPFFVVLLIAGVVLLMGFFIFIGTLFTYMKLKTEMDE